MKHLLPPLILAGLLAFVFLIFWWAYNVTLDPRPNTVVTYTELEFNGALWGIFAIGLVAGFLLAVCAYVPLYRMGKREGMALSAIRYQPEVHPTDRKLARARQRLNDLDPDILKDDWFPRP